MCVQQRCNSVNLPDSFILFHKFYVSKIPHRKKSRGLKPGDRGSHSKCPPYPQTLFPNIEDKTVRELRNLCASAPSCWTYILDKSCKGAKLSRKLDPDAIYLHAFLMLNHHRI